MSYQGFKHLETMEEFLMEEQELLRQLQLTERLIEFKEKEYFGKEWADGNLLIGWHFHSNQVTKGSLVLNANNFIFSSSSALSDQFLRQDQQSDRNINPHPAPKFKGQSRKVCATFLKMEEKQE